MIFVSSGAEIFVSSEAEIFVSCEAEIFGALVTNGVLAAGKRVREQA